MLIILCIAVPIWFAYTRSRRGTGFEINHVTLFTFGFLFYWVLPIAVAPFAKEGAGARWGTLFDSVDQFSTYEWTVFFSYCAFICGDLVGQRMFVSLRPAVVRLHLQVLFLPIPIICTMLFGSVLIYRSVLFSAYELGPAGELARGNVAASVVILGSIALLYLSDHGEQKIGRLLRSRYVLPFVFGALVLLLLGTRLYVVSFALMFLVYRSCFVRAVKLRTPLLTGLAGGLLSGLVGILRLGDEKTSIFLNLILEPIFTSFSLLYFLSVDRIPVIAFPKYLMSDFFNLIPTFILPGKYALTSFPAVYNPLGALHSFVSFAYNFGIVGMMVVFFFMSMMLRWLRARSGPQLARVSYTMITGWLAFSFFRDPFGVSIVKDMVEFSFIIPGAIVLASRFVQRTVPLRNAELDGGSQ